MKALTQEERTRQIIVNQFMFAIAREANKSGGLPGGGRFAPLLLDDDNTRRNERPLTRVELKAFHGSGSRLSFEAGTHPAGDGSTNHPGIRVLQFFDSDKGEEFVYGEAEIVELFGRDSWNGLMIDIGASRGGLVPWAEQVAQALIADVWESARHLRLDASALPGEASA